MALATQSASIGGATKTILVGADGSGNIAAAHVNVNSNGAEVGTTANPLAVAVASVPLATGAATAAKQPAPGAAGAPSADVLTVQGASGGTALPVSLSALPALPPGSNTIGAVTGSGVFTMAGQTAVGSAPSTPPVSISGVDGSGNKQHIRTDTFGTPSDAAWSGTGNGSLVALSKALVAAQQATTAAITASSLAPPTPTFAQSSALSSSLVLKSSAGSLYSCYVTTGATAGYLMLFDASTAPANGAVTPKECIYCPPNATTSIDMPFLAPEPFTTGIVAVFSSTGPFTLNASTTAFIKGIVQ